MNETVERTDYAETLNFHAGEVILFPGQAGDIYRLTSGLVRIHTVDDEGNGLTLRYVKPGGFFGEEALCGLPRRYFAESVTASAVEVVSPDSLEPHDSSRLTLHLAEVVARLYQSLYRLSGKRLKSRVAAELLDLQDSALASVNDQKKPVVHITHDELAAAVGSVRETVTKVVGELAREGAIDAGYGKIALTDLGLLERIAGQ